MGYSERPTDSLNKDDALYLPRESRCTIVTNGGFDLAGVAAPSSQKYPVQYVSLKEIWKNPDLSKRAGFEPYARTLNTLIEERNVRASRLLAGVMLSKECNWTRCPP